MREPLRWYFMANVILLVMLGVVLPFQEPGTDSYAISVVSLVIIVGSLVVSGTLIYLDVDWSLPEADDT